MLSRSQSRILIECAWRQIHDDVKDSCLECGEMFVLLMQALMLAGASVKNWRNPSAVAASILPLDRNLGVCVSPIAEHAVHWRQAGHVFNLGIEMDRSFWHATFKSLVLKSNGQG